MFPGSCERAETGETSTREGGQEEEERGRETNETLRIEIRQNPVHRSTDSGEGPTAVDDDDSAKNERRFVDQSVEGKFDQQIAQVF